MKNYSLVLVGICVAVFIAQLFSPVIEDNFALYRSRAVEEPWMLVTSIFLHGGFTHLFFNMFALGLFGLILENIIGQKKFLLIFFGAGIIASMGAAIFYPASLGASGAIYGILGAVAVLRPRMRIWVWMIPMPMYMAAVFWAIMDLLGMFAPSGTANAAHLFGLGAGIAAGLILRGRFRLPKKKRRDPLSRDDRRRIEDYFDRLEEFSA